MPHSFQHIQRPILAAFVILVAAFVGNAQTPFPTSGFTLPAGKTVAISYEVTVNANACTNGTAPTDISNQSQVQGGNFSPVNTDDPDIAGASNSTVTPFGAITIGNLVYKDVNKDGDYDSGTDTPIDNVQLRLYLDDGDGVLTVGDGAHIASATTTGGGLYSFNVCPGTYIVEVIPANFNSGGPLYDNTVMAALLSSPIGGAPDPDGNTTDNDDNGDPVGGFGVTTAAFTVAYDANPANTSIYNHIDFGFKTPTTVTITNVAMDEGTGAGPTAFNFTVERSDTDGAFSLTVNTNGGTATSGTDFTAISGGTVDFTAGGSNMATVTVNVTHDNIVEANETFTVNLSGAPSGIIITDGTGDGSITNDDAATVTLSGNASQAEGNAGTTTYTVTLTLNNPVQGGFMVTGDLASGTATLGVDFAGPDVGFTFVGNAGETKTMDQTIFGDLTVELNETFTIDLTNLTGAPAGVTLGSQFVGTINNDDAATVSIQGNVSELESVTPQTFTITLSNPVDVPVTVNFSTADNTANAGSDYTGITNQTVTFPANNNTNQTVDVTIANDNMVEANEVYDVSIGSFSAGGRNVSLGTTARTGTIQNNDNATVTLSPVGGVSQNEGNSGVTNFQFTATVDNPVQGGFSLDFSTMDGTATDPSDYTGGAANLTFNGTAGQAINIDIEVNGDLDIENDETFTLQLGAVTAATPVQTAAISIAGSPQTGTILNDEKDWGDAPTGAQSGFANSYPTTTAQNGANHNLAPGGLRLGAGVDAENDGQPNANATGDGADEDGVTLPSALAINTTANITVNASGTGRLNAWVDWNRDGSWGAGEQIFTDQMVTAGNNTLSFPVPSGIPTGNTYARFRLTTATGTGITGNAADGEVEDYQVNVVNNAYSISSPMVTEGSAPNTVVLNYVISRLDNTNAGSVDYSAPGGTATAGTDYVTIPAGTINFTAGGSMSETVSVTVNGDAIVEDNETVVITLSNPMNGGIGTGTGTGSITNDDTATITLTGGTMVNETNTGSFTVEFVATVDKAVQGGFSVYVTTADGTASGTSDYGGGDVNLMFGGFANESRGMLIGINGDNTVELDETFNVQFGSLLAPNTIQIVAPTPVQTAAIMTAGSPRTTTILNDDAATVSLAGSVSQAENLTPQVFTINLSNPVDVAVTVLFNTGDLTATTADNDYNGIVNQTVTFAANTTTAQTVNVTINNDNKVETNETYQASIGTLNASGRNVSLSGISATGTIANDDAATVTLTPVAILMQNEGNSGTTPFVFTATLNNPVQGGFTVPYTTNDGLATTADNDYQDNDGTLTFAGTMGEAQTITVLVNGDLFVEANEGFTVALGPIAGAPAGVTVAGSPRSGLIVNDEIDFGDAPDTYGTLLASNGARHGTSLIVRLGATVDGDLDGQPGALANGDDTDAEGDDDDGVTLPSALVLNTAADITVNASIAGFVNAWVDFDLSGSFDAGELVLSQQAVVAGANALSFAVPAGATTGNSYARFRFTQGPVPTVPTGLQTTGEVEDYSINIINTQFSIDDPTVAEGDAGTSNLIFSVSRTVNANACSVYYTITGGSATSGTDYQPLAAGTLNFTAGGGLSQNITVQVNGDITVELNETVEISLSNPVNASILDGIGTGEITNDDQGVITISNPTVTEGDAGTANATFNINMSNPSDANVSINYTTLDGTATLADNDMMNTSSTVNITAGSLATSFSIPVNGDCKIESNETFIGHLTSLDIMGRNIIFIGGAGTLDGTATITNDDALPVITCPADDEYDTAPGDCSALITLPLPTLSSICGSNTLEWRGRQVDEFNVPLQAYSGYLPSSNRTANFSKGRFEIEWKVTDDSGTSTCSYFIEIEDNELPGITCPGPLTVTCSTNVPAVNLAAVIATDNCPGVSKSHVGDATTNQTCTNRKTVTRTYRATDASGNSTTCAQVITVFDNVKPNFTFVPANVTVQCNSVPAVGTPTASDGCGGVVTIVYDGQTTSNILCTDKYTLTRQWTATDACGNTQTATQRIVVTDTQKPNFTNTPANVTVQCDAIPAVATPTATDNCATVVVITYVGETRTNGTCLNSYTLTRRWVAADNCGNTVSVSQRISVVDTGKPTLTVPADMAITCSDPIPPVGTPTASDGCAGAVAIAYLGQSTTSGNCPGNYQIKRTWRATDACGNTTAATQTIQVLDTGVPVFVTVPGPLTIECNQPVPPLVNPTASDACGGYVHITFLGNVPSGSGCANSYTITRTWRADDLCGNAATTSQVITVVPVPAGFNPQHPVVAGFNPQHATDALRVETRSYETLRVETRSYETLRVETHSYSVNPNPTTDRIWLDLTDFAGEPVTVSIFSDLGQLVWENRIPAVEDLQVQISLREAGAAAGIYTVSVRSASGVVAKRVVLME